ncbi:hypothetical protein KFE80_05155 [bacterium SCSIO 12696]|nr:hypothetical protein KFE80_05155 [bacterium SCSIO 12696]
MRQITVGYVLTLLFTLLFIAVTLWVFVRVGTPVYRVQLSNVVTLLQMVIAGTATDSDWDVFIGVPIQHDTKLEAVRQRCAELTETEYIGGTGMLFTEQGLAEIAAILDSLRE